MNTFLQVLPPGTSMFRRGHVLVLSGFWSTDLLDEFEAGLDELRKALPRARGPRYVTLHLFNYSIAADAVDIALSLVRRTFLDDTIQVAVVAEGTLGEAGLLLLAGSQRKYRKIFVDAVVETQLRSSRALRDPEQNSPQLDAETLAPVALRLLPVTLQKQLLTGEPHQLDVVDLSSLGLVDKLLPRR